MFRHTISTFFPRNPSIKNALDEGVAVAVNIAAAGMYDSLMKTPFLELPVACKEHAAR